jgi:hypothetical protein
MKFFYFFMLSVKNCYRQRRVTISSTTTGAYLISHCHAESSDSRLKVSREKIGNSSFTTMVNPLDETKHIMQYFSNILAASFEEISVTRKRRSVSVNIRLLSCIFIALLFIKPAHAAQSTITEADGYSCMGDDKSRKQTEQAAMIDAKKNAVDYTSTYIKSETQVKDFALQKDLVSAYANADVKVLEELEQGWYKDSSSGDCYKVKIKVEVVPDETAMEKLSQANSGATDPGNFNFPVAPPPVLDVGPSSQQGVATPDVVVVPSGETYVYMVPNTTGVYFYGGYWYRTYEGYWFRSQNSVGSWGMVALTVVPRVVLNVPPESPRFLPPSYYRIHYDDLRQHWQEWDHNHEWHNHDWFKAEMRPDVRAERQALINQERERHSFEMERRRQMARQQSREQEQLHAKIEREHQGAMRREQQQEQNRFKMEQKRQMAQLQRDRKANHKGEGKNKKKKSKKEKKQEKHDEDAHKH